MKMKIKIANTFIFLFLLLCGIFAKDEETQFMRRKRSKIGFIFSLPGILSEISDLWNFLLRNPNLGSAVFRSKEQEIIGRITALSQSVTEIGNNMNGIYDGVIYNLKTTLPSTIRSELQLDKLISIIEQIEIAQNELKDYVNTTKFSNIFNSYETLETAEDKSAVLGVNARDEYELDNEIDSYNSKQSVITKRSARVEKSTLQNFAIWATGPSSDSIKTLLSRLHALIVPKTNLRNGVQNIYSSSNKDLTSSICNLKESPHQVLYNLYNTVALADFKGYAMLQFSYMFLRLNDKGNFTFEAKRETEKFEKRSLEKKEVIKIALTNADRNIYNCDPQQFVEGLNYVRLTNLLQGYIENEVNLNPYGTCGENCAYYYYTEYHGCFKEQFCSKQQQCRGKVVECKYVDSDMNICVSSDPERRYDWVEYESAKILGNKGRCQSRNLYHVNSWWRYLFWHCSYCFCLCDDGNYISDRYFNLREVTSDINSNKVITGVRIIKHNGIIHLQIQQGVLKPQGLVDKSTLSWKPVDNYTIHDPNVESGIDYHTMSWMDRTLDIDEAFGPDEHVLTGIRFRKLGYHLNLEIRTTPINFTEGKILSSELSVWQGNDNTEVSITTPRKEILLINPDIPIRNGPHTVNSKHNQFIKFQATSADTDVAQTTVPYLDSQPLKTNGFPLSGFGFVHRGKPGSGGFIAPKLISYNFKPHI